MKCRVCGYVYLTNRETEITKLIAQSLSTKEIAQRFDISTKTVESHRRVIYRKIGAHNIADVVRYAVRVKLVQP